MDRVWHKLTVCLWRDQQSSILYNAIHTDIHTGAGWFAKYRCRCVIDAVQTGGIGKSGKMSLTSLLILFSFLCHPPYCVSPFTDKGPRPLIQTFLCAAKKKETQTWLSDSPAVAFLVWETGSFSGAVSPCLAPSLLFEIFSPLPAATSRIEAMELKG